MLDPKFTLTETVLVRLLRDGHFHRRVEMKRVLEKDDMEDNTLTQHLSNLRKKLRYGGEDILVSRAEEEVRYKLVRTTASHYHGNGDAI